MVTSTSSIPLWGLSIGTREEFLKLLPRRLEVQAPPSSPRPPSLADSVRKHLRWTVAAGCGFLVMGGLAAPFFKGYPLYGYRNTVGRYVLLLCLLFFIAFVFESGFTWVLWSAKRDIEKIEGRRSRGHRLRG